MFDEDDDLESLRLAALKTLHKPKQPAVKPIPVVKPIENVVPPVSISTISSQSKVSPLRQQPVSYTPSPVPPKPIDPYLPQVSPALVTPNSWDRVISPYAPSVVPPIIAPVYHSSTMPIMATQPPIVRLVSSVSSIASTTNNVQLSPRSAAFVSQNNDILQRRKQRAVSPTYNRSPGRWSRSPSPLRRSPGKKEVRKRSRSPGRQRVGTSPRRELRRDLSPSPSRRRDSPKRLNARWTHNNRSANNSPSRRNNRNSPLRKDRSRSPRRRSRSVPRRRSGSKSPRRQLNRNFNRTDRRELDTKRPRKVSPERKVEQTKKSPTPKRKSPSLSPAASLERILADMDEEFKLEADDDKLIGDDNKVHMELDVDKMDILDRIDMVVGEKSPINIKKVDEEPVKEAFFNNNKKVSEFKSEADLIEDDLLASSDEEEVLTANVDMDLFASEDSESENEGRFKSSSAKVERNTGLVVPFSKLGSSTTVTATSKILSELPSSTNNDRKDRDRDRDRRDRRRDTDKGQRDNWRNTGRTYDRFNNKREAPSSSISEQKDPVVLESKVQTIKSAVTISRSNTPGNFNTLLNP